jgi:hypothetical protein
MPGHPRAPRKEARFYGRRPRSVNAGGRLEAGEGRTAGRAPSPGRTGPERTKEVVRERLLVLLLVGTRRAVDGWLEPARVGVPAPGGRGVQLRGKLVGIRYGRGIVAHFVHRDRGSPTCPQVVPRPRSGLCTGRFRGFRSDGPFGWFNYLESIELSGSRGEAARRSSMAGARVARVECPRDRRTPPGARRRFREPSTEVCEGGFAEWNRLSGRNAWTICRTS